MSKLGVLIYLLCGPAVAGALVIAVLSMPPIHTGTLVAAGLIGFVLGLPLAWWVTRQLSQNIRT